MALSGTAGRLHRAFAWPARLLALNALWVLGVLAGGVLLGAAPATVALYDVLRSVLRDDPVSLWSDFWSAWRSAFRSAQLGVGVPILTVAVVLFYAGLAGGTPFAFGAVVLVAGYVTMLVLLPAVVAHVEAPAPRLWATAMTLGWRQPFVTTGTAVAGTVALLAGWFLAPAALLCFVPSLPALAGTVIIRRGLRRVGVDC